jgi:translation initiation factor 5B
MPIFLISLFNSALGETCNKGLNSEHEVRMIRQPIVSVLGHVDHGKTTLLDRIRGTTVAAREAGQITQHVGASEVPVETIKKICGPLLEKFKVSLTIPGLLFIDTPGHEAFTNLRRRGGALADLAVLVVDVKEGFMPQTLESINILKTYKTPFLLAANKIDTLPGWKPSGSPSFLESLQVQRPAVVGELEDKVYEVVGKLHELGFEAERFDRVTDFSRQVCIVPLSAKTGEGIAELLLILSGLAQRFLQKWLSVRPGPARGTVLEVKEEVGLGKTIDVILYDGCLKQGDLFAVGGMKRVVVSTVKAILQPMPLDEIRDPEKRFRRVRSVSAAAGIKVAASNLEEAIAGAPFWGITREEEAQELWREMQTELERLRIESKIDGVVLKADALGSLEALENLLASKNVPIRLADVGDVSKRDVVEAGAVGKSDPTLGVVLAFNVKVLPDAREEADRLGVSILEEKIIYRLVERLEEWRAGRREELRRRKLEGMTLPVKLRVKPGYIFRRSGPAIVGVEILGGILKPKVPLITEDAKAVGTVREIQSEKRGLPEARRGQEVAISIEGGVVGRNLFEGSILYSDIPRNDVLMLKGELSSLLPEDASTVLEEIVGIKKKVEPGYGVM